LVLSVFVLYSFETSCTSPPTLFPYTTLFRSGAGRALARRRRRGLLRFRDQVRGADLRRRARWRHPRASGQSRRVRRASHLLRRRDRKSTRLNSSHVSISYAVFCLKKKKNL